MDQILIGVSSAHDYWVPQRSLGDSARSFLVGVLSWSSSQATVNRSDYLAQGLGLDHQFSKLVQTLTA